MFVVIKVIYSKEVSIIWYMLVNVFRKCLINDIQKIWIGKKKEEEIKEMKIGGKKEFFFVL